MIKQPQCFVSDLLRAVEAIAPARLAESWDNVGLQIGHPSAPLRRVLTCLEVTPPVLDEAVERQANAIVAHHPLIFQPLTALNLAQPAGALVGRLVREGMALVVAHTNLDSAAWGTNSVLAEACGLTPEGALLPREEEPAGKLVLFVPRGHENAAIEAIARGGGGRIGAYTHCTFRTPGTGTFRGEPGTHPAIGEPERLEEVEEYRIEAIVPERARQSVLREVLAVHPYEEPAYDFYPLLPGRGGVGMGCLAPLDPPTAARDLALQIKERLNLASVRLSGPPAKKVRRVAICSGAGGSFVGKAAGRADAFITGEINYHHAVEAHARGLAVIELGHFNSEVLITAPLARRLAQAEKLAAAGVEVLAAQKDLQPFLYF